MAKTNHIPKGGGALAQQLTYPSTEHELQAELDRVYESTKQTIVKGDLPRWKGMYEVVSSETVILTAIHKIKANKGSRTAGSDDETISDYLQKNYRQVMVEIQQALEDYKPVLVRRKYIPKPGKDEERPLGIPAIKDRIIQECVKIVIEPILEAQFFEHSYGFRPMRSTEHAFSRVSNLIFQTKYKWVVEGDISKFFDTVNHRILVKQLFHMGIRDRRILMLIKKMLQAGIMNEIKMNPMGTPQGGILSPLLANAYLHKFDEWIASMWEKKKTKFPYKTRDSMRVCIKKSNLKPVYLVRYADDWVIVTNSKTNAEKMKYIIAKFLSEKLKITLSEEKTKITNVYKQKVYFLGYEIKYRKEQNKRIPVIAPNRERLKWKVKEILRDTKKLRHCQSKAYLVYDIHRLNSKIRGLIEYYQIANLSNLYLSKYSRRIQLSAFNCLARNYRAVWKPANETHNLIGVHSRYTTGIPAVELNGAWLGITLLGFCTWRQQHGKTQTETPYTEEGRTTFYQRKGKRPPRIRADELFREDPWVYIQHKKPLYNFEYYMNRAYVFNRDYGKCKVCSCNLTKNNLHTHHVRPYLSIQWVNRVSNLASLCKACHPKVHSEEEIDNYQTLDRKAKKKLQLFREKLLKKKKRSTK